MCLYGLWRVSSFPIKIVVRNPRKLTTLKPLINATLILTTLIFAMRGQNLKVFCDINFCDHENRNILRH